MHTAVLNIGNTREILDLTWDYRSRWKLIGIKLGIDAGTLDAIDVDNKSVDGSLVEMINKWLRGDKHWPNPTRSVITSALESLGMSSLTEGSRAPDSASTRLDDVSKQSEMLLSYGSYLKSLYMAQSLSSSFGHDHQWPPPATNRVFRLAMITAKQLVRRGSSIEDELHLRKTVAGEVEQILQKRVPIELKDIFHRRRDKRKKVLIEGAPGCGKSTLSLNICHQWTNHQLFEEFNLVILVRLREPVVQNAKFIADMLPRHDESMGKEVENLMTHSNGNGTLFIFDGWDELSPHALGYKVVLSLLKGTMLHECSIIITSRPTSSANLHCVITSRVEILGFTKSELKQYFVSCLESDQLAETLFQRIQQNPAVLGSCYLPLNASILVHLFKCADHLLPTTQYEIFSLLVCNCIFRHLKKTSDYEISGIRSLENLPPDIKEPFQTICALAYNGVMKDTVSFDLDAGLNTLGLLQGVESFAVCGMSHSYNFLHLSVQELLAARHIANRLEVSQQLLQFRELLGQARFSAVFQFYAAITKLRTPGITDVVMQVVRKCSKECHKIDDRNRLLPLINCLFEAQDSQLCHTVLDQFGSKLNFEDVSLSPSDCLSVGYFLTHARRNYKVNLVNCSIGPEGCRTLFREGNNFHFVYL